MALKIWQLGLGLLLSTGIALLAWRAAALSPSGIVGAILVGTAILGFGGWAWALLLLAFFIPSSLLSRYRERQKAGLAEHFAKTGRRDLGQALANGGWGALLAVIWAFHPSMPLLAAFVGTMAAVSADTWATEIGVLSRQQPRLITTGRTVPAGTSGGVTPLGLAATLAGGASIGLAAWGIEVASAGLGQVQGAPLGARWVVLGALAGLLGSLADSLLGATVQAIYYCDRCGKETERQRHGCGQMTRQVRGWHLVNNDVVNFVASVFGSLIGGLLGLVFL